MKKILPWMIFVAVCLVLDFGLLYQLQKTRKFLTKIEREFVFITEEKEQFKTIIGHFYQKEGLRIPDEECVTDEGDKVTLHEVIKSVDKVLIFRYTSFDCSDCVNTVYAKLANVQNIDKVIVISDFKNIASMQLIKKKYNLEKSVLLKSVNTANLPETPCVFLSDKDLRINKFLIISQKDKVLDNYLRIL
jgi:hypothetical protein